MSQHSNDTEGRKRWSTPALEHLDLSATRSGSITASAEFTYQQTHKASAPITVSSRARTPSHTGRRGVGARISSGSRAR